MRSELELVSKMPAIFSTRSGVGYMPVLDGNAEGQLLLTTPRLIVI